MSSNESRWNRPALKTGYDAFRQAMTQALTQAAHILEYDRLSQPDQMVEARRRAKTALAQADAALGRMLP